MILKCAKVHPVKDLLGPSLTNVLLCHHDKIWLQNCPSEFKPVIHRRCVDDTFLHFRSKHHIEKLKNYLNRQHKNIRFTSQTENENSISFLDIKLSWDNNWLMTSVYRKPTISGVLTTQRFISIWESVSYMEMYCWGLNNMSKQGCSKAKKAYFNFLIVGSLSSKGLELYVCICIENIRNEHKLFLQRRFFDLSYTFETKSCNVFQLA